MSWKSPTPWKRWMWCAPGRVDLLVPAEAEFVLEGTVYRDRRHAEGPFVDLTETQDVVRQEPVLVVKAITHRKDAIWQALLPGALEHKLLMGMPREPTIFRKVNEVVRCLDVNINPGGCSWLHAIVQIDKQQRRGRQKGHRGGLCRAPLLQARLRGGSGHRYLRPAGGGMGHGDALPGRPRTDRHGAPAGLQPGPRAEPETHLTTRIGFDLTRPLETHGKAYEKVAFPEVDLPER